MYILCVRDHMMIAHSFTGEVFGPAQRLHGATYIVDVEFRRRELDSDGIVVDIGLASSALHEALASMTYRNLDADPEFSGHNTTTEFLARNVFDRMVAALSAGRLGPTGAQICSLRVTLRESHLAWAAFEGEMPQR
jgi:6-pyruvoyltetrahydropterin/6-carboxytetrahydropterin synthase